MGTQAPPRRPKASARTLKAGVYLTDGELLLEVRAVRGVRILKAGPNEIPVVEAARCADVASDLPDSLDDELIEGAWIPTEELLHFEVVAPVPPD